jgi:hypothetical protein
MLNEKVLKLFIAKMMHIRERRFSNPSLCYFYGALVGSGCKDLDFIRDITSIYGLLLSYIYSSAVPRYTTSMKLSRISSKLTGTINAISLTTVVNDSLHFLHPHSSFYVQGIIKLVIYT